MSSTGSHEERIRRARTVRGRARVRCILLGALVALPMVTARASSPIEPGSRAYDELRAEVAEAGWIRVRLAAGERVVELQHGELGPSGIAFQRANSLSPASPLPLSAVREIQISVSRAGEGARQGLRIGALAGAAFLLGNQLSGSDGEGESTSIADAIGSLALGAVLGGITGGLIGAMVTAPFRDWRTVYHSEDPALRAEEATLPCPATSQAIGIGWRF